MIRLVVCALWMVASLNARAEGREFDPKVLLGQASAAFQAGRYDEAAETYRRIAASGFDTSDIEFNIGTSALRAGHRGEAIVAFLRALRIDPDDVDAAFNLEEARKGNIDRIVGTREEEPLVERIGARVPVPIASRTFLAAWWIAIAAFIFAERRSGSAAIRGLGVAAMTVAVVAAGFTAAAAVHHRAASRGVVVVDRTAVREGPAVDFKSSFEVHEGLEVRVVARDGDYVRVRLPNGVEGWVAASDVPTI